MKSSKEKILSAALKEFAAHGFGGARMDRIARTAGINKAMVFYYYSSKQSTSPERFLETLPEVYIRFFSRKQNFLKMIGFEIIQNPNQITSLVAEIFNDSHQSPPVFIKKKISDWNQKGLITEPDPVHFFLNIIPLCLFSFLGKPMVEAIFGRKIADNEAYLQKRIQSITNLLKRGMLK